jgi:hypothetical protein
MGTAGKGGRDQPPLQRVTRSSKHLMKAIEWLTIGVAEPLD